MSDPTRRDRPASAEEKRALLARLLREKAAAAAAPAPRIVPRDPARVELPLSYAQQRLWLIDQLQPGNPVYHIPALVRLRGSLDAGALARALQRVVERHEVLRTRFELRAGRPIQIVEPRGSLPLDRVDLTDFASGDRDREAWRRVTDHARRPFDLSQAAPARAALITLGPDEFLFSITMHHIASDAWSIGILGRELSALYEAYVEGGADPLAPIAVQYADFACWQREGERFDRSSGQVDYWRRRLAGEIATLELPSDRPRPRERRFHGGRVRHRIGAELSEALRRLGRERKATPFMSLLTAFKLHLQRLTGESDLLIGTPVAGRNASEVEPLIGIFLNTLVLRTDLAQADGFEQALERVRTTSLEAYAHQEIPFEWLLAELQPDRDPSRTPLFQVFFNMLSIHDNPFRLPGLECELLPAPEMGSMFDLTVYVADQPEGFELSLVFDADLFDEPRIEELARQYEAVLRQVVDDPSRSRASISLVTPEARPLLPDPAGALDATWHGPVDAALARHAAVRPDADALIDVDGRIDYGLLDAATNRLARRLIGRGIDRGETIAIYGHRSGALVWAVLAVLRAGAAFVVVDPAYPTARLLELLARSEARALLVPRRAGRPPQPLLDWASAGEGRFALTLPPLAESAAWDELDGTPATDPGIELGPDDTACIGFTSGSTGRPKGIVGRHGPLSHFLPWHAEQFGLQAGDRFSLLSGLAHDPLQRDIFTPLWVGGAICIPDSERLGSDGWLLGWMRSDRISVAHLTPAFSQLLTRDEGQAPLDSLRAVFFLGDRLTRRDLARLRRIAPRATCVNLYGATETQRATAYFVVAPGDGELPSGHETLPLGCGVPGVQLLVRNAGGGLASIGEPGEIWFRSPHLARGYLDDDRLTAERFTANPWSTDDGDRLYRTGDLGRYRPDGSLEFLGRADHQIKVRGYRIEPEEIEGAITRHPAVQEAAVVASGSGLDCRLTAFLVADDDPLTRPTDDSLREHLRTELPEFMVPARFVTLPRLPLTPNGKLDRAALASFEVAPAADLPARVEPRNAVEEELRRIWCEVLELDDLGVEDDFFALGGHSILATQVLFRVRERFDVQLSLRELFDAPTVAALASRVDSESARVAMRQEIALERRPDGTTPELSFSQQRLWFLDQLEPGESVFNIPGAVRLRGRLDVAALKRALDEIVRRHEVLRSTFDSVDGEPQIAIAAPVPLELSLEDLSATPDDGRLERANAIAAEEAATPFDLALGPLLRARLLRLDEEDHVLVAVMHHIVSDGWSLGVLVRELGTLYAAFVDGRPSPLEELPLQYVDYAVWQRRWLDGERLETQLDYWRARLAGAPGLIELSTDRPRPAVQSYEGARVAWRLAAPTWARLREWAGQESATPFQVLLTAFKALLLRYTGQQDLVLGSPTANRTRGELAGLIGFFVNNLVLRTDLGGDPSFREALARVRETAIGAFAHQDLPFERLVQELRPDRDLSHHPLFQVLLALQNAPLQPLALPGLTLEPVEIDRRSAQFDLSFYLWEEGDELAGTLEYAARLYERETVERMLGHFTALLRDGLRDPDRRLADLELLADDERVLLLRERNDTGRPLPAERTVHRDFERQVGLTPGAIAIGAGEESWTYEQLNERANRLARHLQQVGVRRDDRVGICLERSPALVVALLATLKSGAAYVPLDPAFPARRLGLMIEDSGLRFVVTRKEPARRLPEHEAEVVDLDEAREAVERCAASNLDTQVGPRDPAYVLYTSGSTGRPKGVQIPHEAVVNFLVSMCDEPGIGADDRLLSVTTLSFDISVLELFGPLRVGGQVILAGPDAVIDGRRLAERLEQCEATVMQATPTTWRMMLEAGWTGSRKLKVLCGGEPLPRELADALLPRCAELWNLYGPTETTVWSTLQRVAPGEGSVPIGRPIANTTLYVLDERSRPVPVGVPGELYIGGTGVALGYHGRPELTADRFVADPFDGHSGGRLYRTGDRVRWRSDGALEFLGRIDHQIKIRGFRVELGEIEHVLVEHASCRQAVVIVREDRPGDPRIVAYLVAEPGDSIDAAELRTHARGKLPEYMVPSAFVPLETIPLTPNRKIDRKALPVPDLERGDGRVAIVEPRSEMERRIAAIWREWLGIERIGVGDNFFDLGGHSLLSMRVVARLETEFGLRINPGELIYQTLEQLAATCSERLSSEPGDAQTGGKTNLVGSLRRVLSRLGGGS